MTDVESRLRGSFARQTMMQTLGATMEEAAEGRVVISAPIAAHLLQQQGRPMPVWPFPWATARRAMRRCPCCRRGPRS